MTYNKKMYLAYSEYRDLLFRVVSKITPLEDVEDILQDAFIKSCRIGEDVPVERPKSLLVKIARNLAIDHVRRYEHRYVESRDQDALMSIIDERSSHDDTVKKMLAREEFLVFCDAIKDLPPQCKRAFLLKKVYDYSQKRIASEMNLSESTIEKHIASGVRKCFQKITTYREAQPTTVDDTRSKVK